LSTTTATSAASTASATTASSSPRLGKTNAVQRGARYATKLRLIALDIDGTLLDSEHAVPEANLRAIAAAVEQGIEVALVTGRRFDFALPIAKELPSPLTMIVNNGALVKSKDGVTHLRHLLPAATAREVLELMREYRKETAVVFDRPRAAQVIYENIRWDEPRHSAYFARNREFMAEVSPLEDCLTEDPIQVMFVGSVLEMQQAEAKLRAAANCDSYSLAVTSYDNRDFGMVDVILPNCSKGATLAEWASLHGIKREEIMAIGDNFNDREMLEFAGLPIVMGNSVPELKSFGWRETLSNDEAGVAAAIQKYALGNI
jgi:Cof subfamily protein (haloacid dehalogenase superfamily)